MSTPPPPPKTDQQIALGLILLARGHLQGLLEVLDRLHDLIGGDQA
jgi:hypothetical protein